MEPTLRMIEDALAKHSVPTGMADVLDGILSYQDINRALKDLQFHRRDLMRWITKEVEKEKARIRRDKDALSAQRQNKATAVFDGLAVFGIERSGSTSKDFEEAWIRARDLLEDRQRNDRVLGKSRDPASAVATVDPAVESARTLRNAIDAVRDLDTRIEAVEARIDAVDPYDIDERTVGYINEYAAMGLSPDPDGDGRPVMDPELRKRAEKLGILGHDGPVM